MGAEIGKTIIIGVVVVCIFLVILVSGCSTPSPPGHSGRSPAVTPLPTITIPAPPSSPSQPAPRVIVTPPPVPPTNPPGPSVSAEGIHKIQHVIIIMQENRAFDEYFGTYPGADGIPMMDGAPSVCVPDRLPGNVSSPTMIQGMLTLEGRTASTSPWPT